MQKPHGTNWRTLAIIAVAVAIWGTILALGAYLQLGTEGAKPDIRRFWVVFGCTAGFLGLWGTALWLRARRG